MSGPDPRQRDPVSRGELARRRDLVRAIMTEADVDVVVVRGSCNAQGINGYFRWLIGTPAIGAYPVTGLFSRDGEITVIGHGSTGGAFKLDPENSEYPGATRRLTSPSFPMIGYTAELDGALAAEDLKARGVRRIALVGSFGMGYDFVDRLLRDLGGGVAVVSILDAIDEAKAIKGPEEIDLIRQAAAMQDVLMTKALDVIKPGKRLFEISAELAWHAAQMGCETGFMLGGVGQMGEPGPPMFPLHSHLQGKTAREGDILLVLAENSGPGGMVTHLNRLFVVGRTPPEIADLHAAVLEAQDYTLSMLRPGGSFAEAFTCYNDYMVARGFAPETRLHAHGQGYDIVERPLVRDDETMAISADMNIGIHPSILHRGIMVMATDNYMLGESGAERLHQTERKIFEIA